MTTTITHPAVAGVFEAINTRNPELVRDLVTDDFVDHGSPFPLPPGPDGYVSMLTFVTSTLQIRYEIEDVITADDRVVVRGPRPRHRRRPPRPRRLGHAIPDGDDPHLPPPR